MATAEQIAHWQRRVAELEAELDAAKKLSEVKLIAAELRRTKVALREAKEQGPSSRARKHRKCGGKCR